MSSLLVKKISCGWLRRYSINLIYEKSVWRVICIGRDSCLFWLLPDWKGERFVHHRGANKCESACVGEFKRLAAPLIEATRQEDGCLQYTLYQDSSDSTVFFFYEVHADRANNELHSSSEYLERFVNDQKPLVYGVSDVTVYDAIVRQ